MQSSWEMSGISWFHITLHVKPSGNWSRRTMNVEGIECELLDIPANRLDCPFPVSFEEACDSLSALPRLFIEPDGSFVWVSAVDVAPPWQLDGLLFDRAGRLLYVEVKGNCPAVMFKQLVAAVGGGPGTSFVVQLVRQAVCMDADDFVTMFCRGR